MRISRIARFIIAAGTVFLAGSPASHGQIESGTPRVTFLPGRPALLPLPAADQEPRAGLSKEVGTSRIVLTIGSAFDLVEFRPNGDSLAMLRAGADFFTYALSVSLAGHRLQIDAVDGFFGGHLLYMFPLGSTNAFLRLRVLHRSAHFVDGHFDSGTNSWRGGREPVPFTKDFGELLGAVAWRTSSLHVMAYSALSYSTLIRPVDIRRISSFHGLEIHSGEWCGHVLGKPFILFAAYHLSLDGIPRYVGTNTLAGGMKFGEWSGAGVEFIVRHRSGLDIFGQYYNVRLSSWEIGFLFDLW